MPASPQSDDADSQRARLGRPPSQQVATTILKVTARLLNDRGYRGFTVDDVVAGARISKSTIYRRWSSKELLVIAAFDTFPGLSLPENGNLADRLFDMLKQNVGLSRQSLMPNVLPALVGERSVNPELARAFDAVIDRRREPLRQAIRQGIAAQHLPADCDIELLLDALVGPMFLRQFFYGDDPIDDQTIWSIVMLALRGSGASEALLHDWQAQSIV